MKKFFFLAAWLVFSVTISFAAENPWVGKWKPDPAKSTYVEVNDALVISAPSAGVLRWEYPEIQFVMEGKPDGSAMSITYPTKPKGLTETVRMITPMKLAYAVTIDGKLVQHGTDALSADGKTLIAVSWIAGKEQERRVEVFHKE